MKCPQLFLKGCDDQVEVYHSLRRSREVEASRKSHCEATTNHNQYTDSKQTKNTTNELSL